MLSFPCSDIRSDTGLEFYDAMPTGAKIVSGLFQGLAARASGFSMVPLASVAPALQYVPAVISGSGPDLDVP